MNVASKLKFGVRKRLCLEDASRKIARIPTLRPDHLLSPHLNESVGIVLSLKQGA